MLPSLLLLLALDGPAEPVSSPATPPAVETATAPTPPGPKAPPPAASGHARILVLDLQSVGADPKIARLATGVVAGIVAESPDVDVATNADVRAMLDLEASRETLGCTEGTACMADVAGALGARYVVHGDVGLLGEALVVNLAIFDSQKGESVSRKSVEVPSTDLLRRRLRPALVEMLRPIAALPVEAEPVAPLTIVGGVGVGVGGIAVVGGGLVALVGELVAGDGKRPLVEKTGAINAGRAGVVIAGVGVVVAAVGGGLLGWSLLQDDP